jgi:hypothetical protein
MPILQIPIASAIAWLLAFAFTGAGIFNAMGGAVVQAQFLRWGLSGVVELHYRRARNA